MASPFGENFNVLGQLVSIIGINLFIIDVLVSVCCYQGLPAEYCKPRWFFVLMPLIFSAPSYLILNLSCYAYLSLVSIIAACVMIIALSFESIVELATLKSIAPQVEPQPYKIFMAFTVFFRGLQGVAMIMPIRSSMTNIRQFKPVQIYTTIFIAAIYLICFLLVIFAFGSRIETIVILTFRRNIWACLF